MVKSANSVISVCTWSIGNDFDKLEVLADETSVDSLHLALSPALAADGDAYLARVEQGHWNISATMINFPHEDYSTLESIKVTGGIIPDEHWPADKKAVFDAIDLTAELGAPYLTFHIGFIDLENPKTLIDRATTIADAAAEKDIMVLLETGQETGDELETFLETLDHPALGINFDPANLILYDKGNPLDAVRTLEPWIRHVHIKDANVTDTPGTWGVEVPWGTGQVHSTEFLDTLNDIGFGGALAVEREAGNDRFGDIRSAIEQLKAYPSRTRGEHDGRQL